MRQPFLKRTFHTLTEAIENCGKRFPLTVTFVFALTAYLIWLVDADTSEDRKLVMVLGYYFSIGTLLSLTIHLWSEEIKSRVTGIIVQAVMQALFIADAVYLYNLSPERSLIEIGIAHGAAILALWLSVFFLSFLKEKDDIPSWNFASFSVGSFFTAYVVGLIMSGGICLLVFSLEKLFDVDISWKCYTYILIICCVLLPLLLFLGMLPKGEEKHSHQPQVSEFMSGTIHFLFLPLMAGYLAVLYIYAARILISWELPMGWVSWLVVALMAGCIAIEFGLYPVRMETPKRIDEWTARWLPALVLPLLLLMTVGIARRFNDYGITINRLYIITLNVWFYAVCIGLIFTKARRISWIPISFALLFLLTSALPVNYASITRNSMRNDIRKELAQSGKTNLPLMRDEYHKWLEQLPEATASRVNEKFLYLHNWFGWTSIDDLVHSDGTNFYTASRYYKGSGARVVEETDEDNPLISYSGQSPTGADISIPTGYSSFTPIPDAGSSSLRFSIPHKHLKTGTLPASLGTKTGKMNDTVYIDLSTIRVLQDHAYGKMPPTRFRCNSANSLFMLTDFSLDYFEQGDEDLRLSIKGYLFKK